MTRRMSVSRCCCPKPGEVAVCEPGETSHSDDFTSYPTGTDMHNQNGFFADNTEKLATGQIEMDVTNQYGGVWRSFPFDYTSQTTIEMSVRISRNVIVTGRPISCYVSPASRDLGTQRYGNGPSVEVATSNGLFLTSHYRDSNQSPQTSLYTTIDTRLDIWVKVVYEKLSWELLADGKVEVVANVKFYLDGFLFDEQTDYTRRFPNRWCSLQHGWTRSSSGAAQYINRWESSVA